VPLPPGMMGGVKGRSLRDNLKLHANQPDVVALDLRDCFPRTDNRRVYRAFVEEVGCSPKIAGLLTQLTTYHRRLPQGAPTSTSLANLTLLPMYRDLDAIAKRRGLELSFWVDDIVLSGKGAREALTDVFATIHARGHSVRRRKVAKMHSHERQIVTKGGVNRGPSAGSKRIKEVRGEILALSRQERVTDRALLSVRGRVEFVRAVSPTQGAALDRFADNRLPPANANEEKPKRKRMACGGAHTHRARPARPGQPRRET
jgi:reverse transcriptase-like protein